jgi:hypothetical protein
MGNAPISVGLRTEKTSYRAGDHVNGTVYVSVNQQAQPIRAIVLQLEGREHALVHYTSNETHHEGRREETRVRDHYDESNITFSKMEYPLQTFPNGQIRKGQYEFPFSFKLPQNLPSTMNCRRGQSHCSVEYKLTATFAKPSTNLFSSNPSSEQKLNISAQPPLDATLENTSLMLPVNEVPVITCCCDNKGTMVLQAQFNKTTVKPMDTISVQFRCQNESSVKVKRVQVQLESRITWNGHHGSRNECVKQVLDCREHDAAQFPELAKLHSRSLGGGRSRRTTVSYSAPGMFPYDTDWRHATVQVPRTVHDSYNGHAVQVRHTLTVQMLTKGCCTNDVDATAMVQVFQNLPPNANTMVHGSSSATVPSAPSSVYDESNAVGIVKPVQPSAPPSWKDNDDQFVKAHGHHTIPTATATPIVSDYVFDASPMVQAQALPPNWNAQTASVVEIPMAEAWVMENSGQVTETYDE